MIGTCRLSLVSCALLVFPARFVGAQEPVNGSAQRTHAVGGIVLDSAARTPVAQAEVALIIVGSVRREVITGTDGRFALGDYPDVALTIRVRRLGYQQRMVNVQAGSDDHPTSVEVILTALPVGLDTLVVDVPEQRLREFYARKQQRRSFGRFLEAEDIRRLAPANPSELFRGMPGVTIRAAAAGGNSIRIRGCQPTVWVDGLRIPGAELDDVIQPTDIGGIEFYPSSAGVPAQYQDPSNRLCGLILVWTRSQ